MFVCNIVCLKMSNLVFSFRWQQNIPTHVNNMADNEWMWKTAQNIQYITTILCFSFVWWTLVAVLSFGTELTEQCIYIVSTNAWPSFVTFKLLHLVNSRMDLIRDLNKSLFQQTTSLRIYLDLQIREGGFHPSRSCWLIDGTHPVYCTAALNWW